MGKCCQARQQQQAMQQQQDAAAMLPIDSDHSRSGRQFQFRLLQASRIVWADSEHGPASFPLKQQ